jgi:DNA-binding response OmpR family regulator
MSEGPPPKALLVEDEALVAMITEDYLDAIGFDAVSVDTAAGALDVLLGGGLSLAVIDVGLPDMRGDDLAARARELSPTLPIILASGFDSAELKRRFMNDDALFVLGKPYTENDLRAAITAAGLVPAGVDG